MIDFSKWSFPFGLDDVEGQEVFRKIVSEGNPCYDGDREQFANEYSKLLPYNLNAFIYGLTGTQSIENAIRIAQKITGKRKIICFEGSYHGNSLNLLNIPFRGEGVIDSIFLFATPPYCLRCNEKCNNKYKCIDENLNMLVDGDVAAVLLDPSFGNIVLHMENEYYRMLKKACDKRGILLIFDEIRVAYGRLNTIFAFETLNVIPDILCVSKAIASGIPLALTIYDGNSLSYKEYCNNNYHIESTFAAQRLSLEMALYTVSRLKKQYERKEYALIDYFQDKMFELQKKKYVYDVRCLGMICAIEFANPRNDKPSIPRAINFVQSLQEQGIITNGVRYKSNVLLHPYLNITKKEIDKAYDIMANVLDEM